MGNSSPGLGFDVVCHANVVLVITDEKLLEKWKTEVKVEVERTCEVIFEREDLTSLEIKNTVRDTGEVQNCEGGRRCFDLVGT